jgi:hypothetical protein
MEITIKIDDPEEAIRVLSTMTTRGSSPTSTVAEPTAEPTGEATITGTEVPEVDANGMPWDPDIHAATKSKKADGTWVARRGKSEEAAAALAAFKAGGAGVEPPADVPPAAEEPTAAPVTGMPNASAPVAGMPTATAPADMPPPVTNEQMIENVTRLMSSGKLSQEDYAEILTRHGVDLSDPAGYLATRESVRVLVNNDFLSFDT